MAVLTLFLSMSQSRTEGRADEIALVTGRTEVTTTAIYDLLKSVYNMRPPQIVDKLHTQQPIIFEDAIGRVMELPQEFFLSFEVCIGMHSQWLALTVA